MSCLELRRAVLADPRHLDDEARAHAASCAECAAFIERARRFDADLERALRLPVPGCLGARILLRRSIGHDRPALPTRVRAGLAVAAGLLLVLLVWPPWSTQRDALIEDVRAYAAARVIETPLRAAPGGVVSPESLGAVLADVGITVDPAAGPFAGARPCVIENALGAHLVVTTDAGPVSVLVLPSSELSEPMTLDLGDGWRARLLPCPRGSLAIIGIEEATLDLVQRRFEHAVGWI